MPQTQCQRIMIECFPVINWKNLVCENGSKSLGFRKVICYLASSALELGEEPRSPKKGNAREEEARASPTGGFRHLPGPSRTPPSAFPFSRLPKQRFCPQTWKRGFPGPKPAPRHLPCTSPNHGPA